MSQNEQQHRGGFVAAVSPALELGQRREDAETRGGRQRWRGSTGLARC